MKFLMLIPRAPCRDRRRHDTAAKNAKDNIVKGFFQPLYYLFPILDEILPRRMRESRAALDEILNCTKF